ncbi:MAG: hypothetical protein ACYDB7_10270 [Mycobacteriales bacterium]
MAHTRGLRALVAATSLAFIAFASPVMASGHPRPQIEGSPGDWAVPSQNILSGLITVAHGQIRVQLTLSAAPTPGLRTVYAVVLYTGPAGCVPYVLEYDWNGSAALSTAKLGVYACAPGDVAMVRELVQPMATYPATATPVASGVLFQAPLAGGLRPGLRTYAAGIAESGPTMVIVGTSRNSRRAGGDIAYGTGLFVLGD